MKKWLTVAVAELASGLPRWDGDLLKYIFLMFDSVHKCPPPRPPGRSLRVPPGTCSLTCFPDMSCHTEITKWKGL